MHYYNSQQVEILIEETPLGQGGQGNVYEIISPIYLKDHVVKIYHLKERSPKRELKINYMIQNPPDLEANLSLIWPEDTLFCDGEFVGFIMPKALGEADLTSLSVLSESKKLDEYWKSHFSRNTEQGMLHRAKVCQRIAEAVGKLHNTGQYVLVDIKPENIKVSLNGQVSLIDLDSIEIIHQNELLFAADKLSTEYSPSEIQVIDLQKDIIPIHWDSFSLAVVFYKVLFGLHPFTGTPKKDYESFVTLEQKIKAGLLPVGRKSRLFKIIPAPHQNFKSISKELQTLFLNALDVKGYTNPSSRPGADDWSIALEEFKLNRKKYHKPSYQKSLDLKKRQKVQYSSGLEYLLSRQDKGHGIISIISLFVFFIVVWLCINFNRFFNPTDSMSYQQFTTMDYYDFGSEEPYLMIRYDKYGYINRKKQVVIDFQYDKAKQFVNGLARVEKDSKQGFINALGEAVVPLVYDRVYDFKEGLARVRLNGKEGFVNPEGDMQIPLIYERVDEFVNGRAGVVLNGKIGVIDQQGKEIIPIEYNVIIVQGNGIYKVTRGGMTGFLDQSGDPITPLIYTRTRNFSEGLVAVFLPGKGWGYITATGATAISFGYMDAHPFHEGLAKVETLHGCGFINEKGQKATSWQYEMAENFSEGMAAIKIKNKWGFINRKGDMVIAAEYDKVFQEGFQNGKAKVLFDKEVIYINKNGQCITNCP